MSNREQAVETHWTVTNLGDTILEVLQQMGEDIETLTPADLAPIDEFHIRGREATQELASLTGVRSDWDVLDVGSGLGGSARYLALEYGCHVTGIDLTQAYCNALRTLLESIGFRVLHWYDVTQEALAWFRQRVERVKVHGLPPLGTHLLAGADARMRQENQVRNLEEERIVLIQAVLDKVR